MNIDGWEKYFSERILLRGEQYYLEGRVHDLTEEYGFIEADVYGRKIYTVEISEGRFNKLQMFCDCPHSLDGYYCKHMAAVLYEYDAKYPRKKTFQSDQKRNEPEIVTGSELFPDTPERRALYYNMNQIAADLNLLKKTVEDAKKLVAEKKIRDLNASQVFSSGYFEYQKRMSVTAFCGTEKQASYVKCEFDRDCITYAYCNNCYTSLQSYWNYGRNIRLDDYCVHEVALLLSIDEYLLKFNPGDSTDLPGTRILQMQRSRTNGEIKIEQEKKKDIVLEPRLILDDEGFTLSFRIGAGKLYVVKNLSRLCKAVEASEVMELGKNNSISFLEETFTDESLKLFKYLKSTVRNMEKIEKKIQERLYYQAGEPEVKNSFPLEGEALDKFYDLFHERNVPFQNKIGNTRSSSIIFMEKNICAKMDIEPEIDDGRLIGVNVYCELPTLFDGEKYKYIYDGSCISRINEEDRELLDVLEDALEYGDGDMFSIGHKNLRDFYYRVLPEFEKSNAVTVTEKNSEITRSLLPPELQFNFYLDVENGIPCCKGEAVYEDFVHPLQILGWDDLPLEPYRDYGREQGVCSVIMNYFPEYESEGHTFYYTGPEENLIPVMQKALRHFFDEGQVQATDAFDRLKVRKMPTIKVGVSIESDLMDLSISSSELSFEEVMEILASYRKKKHYHRLKDGRFIGLENDETLQSLDEIFDSMQISAKDFAKGKLHLPLYRALYLDKLLEEHDTLTASRDRNFKKILRDFGNIKDADVEMPDSLSDILRPYQAYGVQWIHLLKETGLGGVLADDMGLGKTLQVIAALLIEKEKGTEGTSLIVCPASLVYNWLDEIGRFAPDLSAACAAGTKAERTVLLEDAASYDVLITSYDLLKRDVNIYQDHKFLFMVIDEAQYIKNPKTAGAKAVKVIRADHRLALTGTPIENRLSELWSIFDFLMPGFLYNYSQFQKQFETPIVKYKEKQAEERLRKMIAPFVLRRLKMEVLKDLPEKMEEIRYSVFEEKQQLLYDAQVTHMKMALDGSEDISTDKIAILAELTKIRQICCDPHLLFDNYDGESAKRLACTELVQSAIDGGHKILVFSQFTSMLALLEESFKEQDISYYKLTGSTSKEERIRMMRAFNVDDTQVFLISLKAGGTGLNLTGADVVIHYDPWWNIAVQNQATDRAHRIGQDKIVTVYKLIAKNTIEEKIVKLQEEKKDLANAILTGEHTSLASLSKEELMDLLQ